MAIRLDSLMANLEWILGRCVQFNYQIDIIIYSTTLLNKLTISYRKWQEISVLLVLLLERSQIWLIRAKILLEYSNISQIPQKCSAFSFGL